MLLGRDSFLFDSRIRLHKCFSLFLSWGLVTHIVFLDQPPLFWSVINMVFRVGLLVVTRFVVVDFPVARNGSVVLAWGLVPAAATAIIVIMRVVPTYSYVVIRLVRRVCVSSRLRFVALDDAFCHACR